MAQAGAGRAAGGGHGIEPAETVGDVGRMHAVRAGIGLDADVLEAGLVHGAAVRVAVTVGTVADCTQALPLVKGLKADAFLADRGYDTDAIVEGVQNAGMDPVIPPRAHRKVARHYDKYLYKMRHLVENAFLRMKEWRGIATRYAKRLSSYLAFVQIRCAAMWLKVIS